MAIPAYHAESMSLEQGIPGSEQDLSDYYGNIGPDWSGVETVCLVSVNGTRQASKANKLSS